jgi:hypothetical protein
MIDLIGVGLATALLFLLAAVVSAVLAAATWLSVRKARRLPRYSLILAAILIPFATAVHLWLCAALLPGESLFGNVSEPLPNGYQLEALGKMPDFASISKSGSSFNEPAQYIGKLAVEGPLVVGQYSHPFDASDPQPNEPFFLFDTRDGETTDFPTQKDLQTKLGHSVELTDVLYFRSPVAATRLKLDRAIELTPPILAFLLLIAAIVSTRIRIHPESANIYT